MTSLETSTKKQEFCLNNQNIILYFKHIGVKKSKLMVNMLANRVMSMDNDEEKRNNYMIQLNKATNGFLYTFNKSPF